MLGMPNHWWCDADGASTYCPLACGKCNGINPSLAAENVAQTWQTTEVSEAFLGSSSSSSSWTNVGNVLILESAGIQLDVVDQGCHDSETWKHPTFGGCSSYAFPSPNFHFCDIDGKLTTRPPAHVDGIHQ